jgi:TolB-like protein/Tfp pilus assembly protein PilF
MLVERVFFAGNVSINKRQEASIAVLPFVNMSAEEENEFFADGLTEQILDELAQLSGLQVTARTSSFKFKDKNEDVRKIGEELTVNYILEGSVQYDGRRNRIKITTQLINANNGYHLWSETYEDDFDEVFGIQEDVSRKVASQLKVQLLPEEEKALSSKLTDNTEAYKLYLKARQFSMKRTDSDLQKAIELLNQALELDSNFAEAHAELAFVYPQRHFYGNLSKEDRDELRQYHLDRALELAPDKPEALRAKALRIYQERGDSSQVINDLRRAIKLKPSYADGYYFLNQALSWAKQPELALKSLEKAVELDPLNNFFAEMLASRYFYSEKQYARALDILDRTIANDSSGRSLRFKALMIANHPYGDMVQAFKLIHKAGKSEPYIMGNLNYQAMFALDLDLPQVSEKFLDILKVRYPDNEVHTFSNVSFLHAYKKEFSKQKDWIDFWVSEKSLDKKTEVFERVGVNVGKGKNKEALELFESEFPELKNGSPDINYLDYGTAEDWVFYIDLLKLNKVDERADSLVTEICDFYKGQIAKDSLMPSGFRYNILLDCYYLSDDLRNFTRTLRERYFDKRSRFQVYSHMMVGWYQRFESLPEYQDLFREIETETHRMRAEVIEYLKEEGDWDPAWDEELGLD